MPPQPEGADLFKRLVFGLRKPLPDEPKRLGSIRMEIEDLRQSLPSDHSLFPIDSARIRSEQQESTIYNAYKISIMILRCGTQHKGIGRAGLLLHPVV